jgi:hypothetical protein
MREQARQQVQAGAWRPTEKQALIAYDAVTAAWADGMTFTVQGFCARFGHPCNRHTRYVLALLVQNKRLHREKMLFSDGHYRFCFCAQRTMEMWTEAIA